MHRSEEIKRLCREAIDATEEWEKSQLETIRLHDKMLAARKTCLEFLSKPDR